MQLTDILGKGRTPQICRSANKPPWYPANIVGKPLVCLPTLVSYIGSHAFRYSNNDVPGQGLVHDETVDDQLCSLTIEEREQALGYAPGTTNHGVSFGQRHAITGGCMDANAMQTLLAIALGLHMRHGQADLKKYSETRGKSVDILAPEVELNNPGGGETAAINSALGCSKSWLLAHPTQIFIENLAMAYAIPAEEEGLADNGNADVWSDELCISYIRDQAFSTSQRDNFSYYQRQRAIRRSKSYSMVGGKLFRLFSPKATDGVTRKEVPQEEERSEIVKQVHEQCGHFGRKRTSHLLMLSYWWPGMYKAVRECILNCQACSRMNKITFNSQRPELQPLPIMGLFYRWHVDLCGPFQPFTPRGNKYVMVCIEAFSKFAVMTPIPQKTTEETAYAFLHNVLIVPIY